MSERIYEILFIADPNLGEPGGGCPGRHGPGLRREGRREASRRSRSGARSAWPTPSSKHREGSYVLMVVEGGPALVKEVERRIRVTDGVLRSSPCAWTKTCARRSAARRGATVEDAKRRERTGGRPPGAGAGGGGAVSSNFGGGGGGRVGGGGGGRGGAKPGGGPGGRGGDKKEQGKRYFFRRRKVCKFCADKIDYIDYKDVKLLISLRARARQDPAAAHVRHLRRAPAQADAGHQAGAQHRPAAVRVGVGGRGESGVVPASAGAHERPEPRSVLWAALLSVLVFSAAAIVPLLFPLLPLAPFPLSVLRLRSNLGNALLAHGHGGGAGGAPSWGRDWASCWPCVTAPGLVLVDAMARGRGMRRGHRLVDGLRGLRAGPGAAVRARAHGGHRHGAPGRVALGRVRGGPAGRRAAGGAGAMVARAAPRCGMARWRWCTRPSS